MHSALQAACLLLLGLCSLCSGYQLHGISSGSKARTWSSRSSSNRSRGERSNGCVGACAEQQRRLKWPSVLPRKSSALWMVADEDGDGTSNSSMNSGVGEDVAEAAADAGKVVEDAEADIEAELNGGKNSKGFRAKLKAVYQFSRPHTIRGTILASVTGVLRALIESPGIRIDAALLPRAFIGMISLLLGNAYIVGINQIFDVKIDRINKPFLPIAAGKMSKQLAWAVVAFSAVLGPLLVHANFSPMIFGLYSFGLLMGGLYSVPPIQLKRFPVAAGLCIACVRGFLLNFGVYYAVKEALLQPLEFNAAVAFLARFMTVFAMVIAVTKDLPDIDGDKRYNISTFATRNGVHKTAKAASIVLGLNYVSAVVQGAVSPAGAFRRSAMIGGHTLLAGYLWQSFKRLEAKSQASVKSFYKRIWDLFYMEYVLYLLI